MTDAPDDDQPTLDGAAIPSGPAFEAPLAAADVQRCPACLSPVRADQRYCLECGERLRTDELPPAPTGASALSERGTGLLVAAAIILVVAGAGLSWVALREPAEDDGAQTTATDTLPTGTGTTDTMATDTGSSTGDWPADLAGWAVILASKEQDRFTEADARAIADQASAAGVAQTGVLDSSQFPSLNPGYWAVFSGPYDSRADAELAAETIRSQGYPEAYAREVAP